MQLNVGKERPRYPGLFRALTSWDVARARTSVSQRHSPVTPSAAASAAGDVMKVDRRNVSEIPERQKNNHHTEREQGGHQDVERRVLRCKHGEAARQA